MTPAVRLFTPGPVEVPERILRAMAAPPPHHRTDGFRETLKHVTSGLQELHGTLGEVFTLAASGTGAMEAAVTNLITPGERSLAIAGGKFGERWAKLLEAFGFPHETVEVEWGRAVDPAEVRRRLDGDPSIRAVFATHSETSTGALHDVAALAGLTRARGVRLIVDAVTSLGVHPFAQDEWGVDTVVCGSQKGMMLPPGLATVSLAPWAADAIEGRRAPRFYFDLRRARRSLPLGETAFTPPVSLVLGLDESLAMIREEGLAAVHERHAEVARAVREGAARLGFVPFADPPSNAVSALQPPPGIDASAIVRRLRDRHSIVIAGGQDRLKGTIVRIGHMGHYRRDDVELVLVALEECVRALAAPAAADDRGVRA